MNAGEGGDPSHLKKESECYRKRIKRTTTLGSCWLEFCPIPSSLLANMAKDNICRIGKRKIKRGNGGEPILMITKSVFWAPNGTRISVRCHVTVPKNSRIPGPNPLPLPLVMDMNASKTLCTWPNKS
jgi:hypothetical protein